MTDKNQVRDWLSEVVHPAREDRSLVELGMVDSIEIAEGRIEVTLAFPKMI
jgi:metal-sulfur cluster biosynthetic enzyme